MALEGNLKDFALSEILQLISVQQKTGYLQLRTAEDHVEIWFEKGRIVYATRAQHPLNEQIKEHLIKTQKLPKDVIERVENASAESRVSFEKVLVSGGYLSGKELSEISAFLIEEMIHGLFNWQEGKYSFDADQKRSDSPANVSLKTEGILMEGMRRLDEWPSIREKLSSDKIIVKRGEADPDEFSLTDDELKLIDLAGNGKTLSEIVEVSGTGKYRTYESICNLMEVNLVDTVAFEAKTGKDSKSFGIDIVKFLKPIGAFLSIIIFIGVCGLFIIAVRMGLDLIGFSEKQKTLADEAEVHREVENLQAALDVFLVQYASYPIDLQELVNANLVKEEGIYDNIWILREDRNNKMYIYTVEKDGLSYSLQTSIGEFTSK